MIVPLKRIALLVLLGFAVTSTVPVGAGPAGGVLRIGIDVDAGTPRPAGGKRYHRAAGDRASLRRAD